MTGAPDGWKEVSMVAVADAVCHPQRWWESPSKAMYCATCYPTPWLCERIIEREREPPTFIVQAEIAERSEK